MGATSRSGGGGGGRDCQGSGAGAERPVSAGYCRRDGDDVRSGRGRDGAREEKGQRAQGAGGAGGDSGAATWWGGRRAWCSRVGARGGTALRCVRDKIIPVTRGSRIAV